MFCPVCGKELDRNEQYCSQCGSHIVGSAPIPYEKPKITKKTPSVTTHRTYTTQPSRPYHSSRRRRGLTVGLFIGILLLAGGGIFGIIMAVNWGSLEGYNYYYYDNSTPASVESINFEIEVSDVLLQYNETETDHLIEIDYHYLVSGAFLDEKTFDDVFKVTWDNESAVATFISDFQWLTNWVFNDRSLVTITLRSDIVWAIDGAVTTGSLDFVIPEDTQFDNFTLSATTGDIDLTLLNGTVFQKDFDLDITTGSVSISGNEVEFYQDFNIIATTGDIDIYGGAFEFKGDFYAQISTGSMEIVLDNPEIGEYVGLFSTTGDINLQLIDPRYNSNVSTWIADASTGSIDLILTQSNSMTTNITANFHATTGDIDVDLTIPSSFGAHFASSVVTGDIDYYNNGGFVEDGNDFQTSIYPRSSNYDFTLGVSTGSIDVWGLST